MARFETSVEARDLDDESKVYDAVCHDNALDETCFRSVGWSSEDKAKERIAEHAQEHATATVGRELEAFRTGVSQEDYEKHIESLQTVVDVPVENPMVLAKNEGGAE